MNIPARYDGAKWADVPLKIRQAVDAMGKTKRGLYIHGGIGSGKTHIIYAIAAHLAETKNHHAIVWNTSDLFYELRADFNRLPSDRARPEDAMSHERPRLAILDDIGAEKATDFVIETLYRVVNDRYNWRLPTIFTSNLSLGELADRVGERIASRIAEMCEIINLTGGDRRIPQ